MAEREFIVARHHIGDQEYAPGDIRMATPSDVAHLVAAGTLIDPEAATAVEIDEPAAKATAEVQPKADEAAAAEDPAAKTATKKAKA